MLELYSDAGTEQSRISASKSDMLRVIVRVLEQEDVYYSLPTMRERRDRHNAQAVEGSVQHGAAKDDAYAKAQAYLAAQIVEIEAVGSAGNDTTQIGDAEVAQLAATAGVIVFTSGA